MSVWPKSGSNFPKFKKKKEIKKNPGNFSDQILVNFDMASKNVMKFDLIFFLILGHLTNFEENATALNKSCIGFS